MPGSLAAIFAAPEAHKEWRARLSGGQPERPLLLYVGRLSRELRLVVALGPVDEPLHSIAVGLALLDHQSQLLRSSRSVTDQVDQQEPKMCPGIGVGQYGFALLDLGFLSLGLLLFV